MGYLEYKMAELKLINIDLSKSYDDWKKDCGEKHCNQIYNFKQLRNKLIHKLATHNSSNPELIDFDSYIHLAKLGRDVAENLSRGATGMK